MGRSQGRPCLLTDGQVSFLVKKLDELIQKVDCKYTVTVGMMKKATRTKASKRIILKATHQRNVYFRAMRDKPQLTQEDIKQRYAFAQKYSGKSNK